MKAEKDRAGQWTWKTVEKSRACCTGQWAVQTRGRAEDNEEGEQMAEVKWQAGSEY